MPTAKERILTAMRSLDEFQNGDWEGKEGFDAIYDSLSLAVDEIDKTHVAALEFYNDFIGYINSDEYDLPDSQALREALIDAGLQPDDEDAHEVAE